MNVRIIIAVMSQYGNTPPERFSTRRIARDFLLLVWLTMLLAVLFDSGVGRAVGIVGRVLESLG
jgi:hypothetical protein